MSLKNFNPSEVEKAFSGLPTTIKYIDFSDDKLIKHLSNPELVAFLQTIPNTVNTIDLRYNKLFKGKTAAEQDALLQDLKAVDPDGSRLNLAHNGESISKTLPAAQQVSPKQRVNSILHETRVNQHAFFSQVKPASDPTEKQLEPIPDPSCCSSPA